MIGSFLPWWLCLDGLGGGTVRYPNPVGPVHRVVIYIYIYIYIFYKGKSWRDC
ncbi:hypothetical protein ACMBCM_09670 [Spiroplasma sp. K1]